MQTRLCNSRRAPNDGVSSLNRSNLLLCVLANLYVNAVYDSSLPVHHLVLCMEDFIILVLQLHILGTALDSMALGMASSSMAGKHQDYHDQYNKQVIPVVAVTTTLSSCLPAVLPMFKRNSPFANTQDMNSPGAVQWLNSANYTVRLQDML